MDGTGASATGPGRGTAPLAYFWGDDAYGLDAALEAFRADTTRFPDGPPERWRPETDRGEPARLLGEIRERLGTGSMFGSGSVAIDPAIRHQMIAEAAYLRAETRGFSAGDPIDDWLAAEQEVDSLLTERATQITQ